MTLNPVMQYPKKDIVAPSSSTVNTNTNVFPDGEDEDSLLWFIPKGQITKAANHNKSYQILTMDKKDKKLSND